MESLVANYGSDDDEDEVQPCPSEIPARRNSLFASLPRPKLAREDTWIPDFRISDDRIINSSELRKASETSFTAAHRDAGDTLTHRDTDKKSRLSDASDGAKVVLQKDAKPLSDGANGAPKEDAAPFSQGNKRVSLFGALPPPKSTGSSVGFLKSQPIAGVASRRVVEIRPVINMALLQELDDDDNIQPQVKRHASEGMASGKATGLAAILPKPKNLGSTLGSGYASGHHATLDVGASVNSLSVRSESKSSDSAPQSMHESSSYSQENTSETWNNYEHFSVSAPSGAWDGYSHDVGADLQDHASTVQENAASSAPYHSSISLQDSVEVLHPEDYYDVPDDFSQGIVAQDTYSTPMPSAQDHLANMLMKERRKGGKNAPLNIIEVKQADLTATKLREDQLRTTGIAFGPAYRPISSNKDKPSKLHRRKHQIGSLYYDMKQKEMELLERRSRGNMTKSETQAKYGW